MIIDSHCHASDRWFEPVETLLYEMDQLAVDRAFVIQMLGEYDNGYQQACVRRHSDRLISFVGVDWTLDDAVETLRRLRDDGARGVRLRPGARSPGSEPLAIWRAAMELGLIVSCVGTVAQFASPEFVALVAELPSLPVLLEHLGGLARPDAGDISAVKGSIGALAARPNVHLKVPGLGQLETRDALTKPVAGTNGNRHLILEMLKKFGAERLHWGSDFPVVASREGYANALRWTAETLPDAARQPVMGGSAHRLISAR